MERSLLVSISGQAGLFFIGCQEVILLTESPVMMFPVIQICRGT